MADRDAHMGDNIINKHKQNLINIKNVANFQPSNFWLEGGSCDWDKTLG